MGKCQCFYCRNKDKQELIDAYNEGYIDACNIFLKWAEDNNISLGPVEGNTIESLHTQMRWNRDSTACLLETKEDSFGKIERIHNA